MAQQEVRVPDIGDFDAVDVIDVLIEPGDVIAPEDPLITLESDKATMDVPSPAAGTVAEIHVAVGDQVGEGALIVTLEGPGAGEVAGERAAAPAEPAQRPPPRGGEDSGAAADDGTAADGSAEDTAGEATTGEDAGSGATTRDPRASESPTIEVRVPDIGDFEAVDVIDVLVEAGATVAAEDPLITLESDKATMDVPSPSAGTVERVVAAVGDKVSEGDLIVVLRGAAAAARSAPERAPPRDRSSARSGAPPGERRPEPPPAGEVAGERAAPDPSAGHGAGKAHASPAVRKFARELGVDVTRLSGSGPKARILKTDVQAHVKSVMHGAQGAGGFAVPGAPEIDFSQFGDTETTPLSKVRRLTGRNLHRSWVTAPHVFQLDEADITELEEFRKAHTGDAERGGAKLTLLAFLIKASVAALQRYPDFNASLSADGEALIHKKYFHIGMAVSTAHGLVVPVIRDADRKGIQALAEDIRTLAGKARERKIKPAEMQGACFTISSLGGIGGRHFTPIINLPEVAILGVSPSRMQPVWQDGGFVPRLMLPFTLSYDHRVIDGAAAAQFTRYLSTLLGDIRHLLL